MSIEEMDKKVKDEMWWMQLKNLVIQALNKHNRVGLMDVHFKRERIYDA